MRYPTILLDLDHTLFDSDASETAAFSRALNAVGIADADGYASTYRSINLGLWAGVERGEIRPQEVRTLRFERLVAELEFDADALLMADEFVAGLAATGELYPGVRVVLDQLSAQARLAMVTNGLGEVQRARIERLDIGHYFDSIVVSAEVGVSKPGTEIFDIVFEQLDAPPKKSAVMVGDSLSSDIQGGTNYGIATCWYNPQGKSAQPSDRITHEIRQLDELLEIAANAKP